MVAVLADGEGGVRERRFRRRSKSIGNEKEPLGCGGWVVDEPRFRRREAKGRGGGHRRYASRRRPAVERSYVGGMRRERPGTAGRSSHSDWEV